MRAAPIVTGRRNAVSRTAALFFNRQYGFTSSPTNVIQIQSGTFYREHPASVSGSNNATNPAYFPDLTFSLPATTASQVGQPTRKKQHWAVIGAKDITTFLDVLRGSFVCIPPNARTFPYLSTGELLKKDPRLSLPSRAIQYVGFNATNAGLGAASAGVQGAYMSARYESRREETDWTVLQYLKGETELNPDRELKQTLGDGDELLHQVIKDLKLEKLLKMPVSHLSNGQTRRSRIAKALLSKPELLLLDEPFMGLDPPTLVRLSPMLRDMAWKSSPLLTLALRPQDPVPDWITHLVVLGANRNVVMTGAKADVLFGLWRWSDLFANGGMNEEGETWLKFMEETYGEPLGEVGDSLTDNGIEAYDVYQRAKEQQKKYFDGLYVRRRGLKWEKQKLWETAYNKPVSRRTTADWMILTASVPSDFDVDVPADTTITLPTNAPTRRSAKPEGTSTSAASPQVQGDTLIEISSLVLKYGEKTVLGHPPPQLGQTSPGLNLKIHRGSRLALLGPNGSGKTTLLALLTSDHPQSYSLPIKFFGRDRLPSKGVPGLSLWEIQSRIGHSSPEVHAFFPKKLTVRRTLESAWAETFSSKPHLNEERTALVDRVLSYWQAELRPSSSSSSLSSSSPPQQDLSRSTTAHSNDPKQVDLSWATSTFHTFASLPFGTQRLLLLLRAQIKQPDILILDEAFSGLNAQVRDKAMSFLDDGAPGIPGLTQDQAMVVVSHLREEIPQSINAWIRLPSEEEAVELGKGVETGVIDTNTESVEDGIRSVKGWNAVWGL